MKLIKTVIVCLFLYSTLSLWSDVFHLSNGDRLTGKLIGINSNRVAIKSDYAGLLYIDKENFTSIRTDGEFVLISKDRSSTSARITPDLELSDISQARERKSVVLGQINQWQNRVDASMLLTSGNSRTNTYQLRSESNLVRGQREYKLIAALARDELDGVPQKDQFEVNYSYRLFYADKWFGSLGLDHFMDPIKNVDSRTTTTAGLGHRFWNHTYGHLTAELGISQVFEDLNAMNEQHPALRWALDYKKSFAGGKVEAFHDHKLLRIPEGDRGLVINSSNGLRYLFSNQIDFNLRTDIQHESRPIENAVRTDISYVAGLGMKF